MSKAEEIKKALFGVMDPELGFDVMSLGLIYDVSVQGGAAKVTMTLSTKACPMGDLITGWVKEAALKISGIESCEIELVWEPEWNIDMAKPEVRFVLAGG